MLAAGSVCSAFYPPLSPCIGEYVEVLGLIRLVSHISDTPLNASDATDEVYDAWPCDDEVAQRDVYAQHLNVQTELQVTALFPKKIRQLFSIIKKIKVQKNFDKNSECYNWISSKKMQKKSFILLKNSRKRRSFCQIQLNCQLPDEVPNNGHILSLRNLRDSYHHINTAAQLACPWRTYLRCSPLGRRIFSTFLIAVTVR